MSYFCHSCEGRNLICTILGLNFLEFIRNIINTFSVNCSFAFLNYFCLKIDVKMNLIDQNIEVEIQNQIINPIISDDIDKSVLGIETVLRKLYDSIPDNKRISYGRVYTVKVLSKYLFEKFPNLENTKNIFDSTSNWYARATALGVLSYLALEDYHSILPYFEKAASDENWDVREMAQMFFRKLIKKHPDEMQKYLLVLVKSDDPNIRRFVSETLRSVQENKWFYKNPDYSLKVLRHLFQEKAAYPRTSVGNNLSDLARHLPELVYKIVEELVKSGDKNSYWIAYRACRNLVKKEPNRVMDLLHIDEYKYKNNKYTRSDKRN